MFTVITPPPSSGCRVALAALNCDLTMSSRRQPRSLAQLHLMEGVSEKQPGGLTVSSSPSAGRQHRRFRPALRLRTVAKGNQEVGNNDNQSHASRRLSDQRRSCASDGRARVAMAGLTEAVEAGGGDGDGQRRLLPGLPDVLDQVHH